MALPKKESKKIAETKTIKKGNWGYIPVEVTIGKTTWRTGIWPQKDEGVYLLVIKAPVRKKEGIFAGDTVRAFLTI